MLNVEIYNRYEKTDHDDIERLFAENIISLPRYTTNCDILRTLEHGRYCNEWEFVDRFGRRCPLSYCSTSTKAALLVANAKRTVDLAECSLSARDYILTHFSEGDVIVYYGISIGCLRPVCIDVRYRNYHFSRSDRLGYYLQHEYPDRPDFTYCMCPPDGVEVLDWKQPWGENTPEDRLISILHMLWAYPKRVVNPERVAMPEVVQVLEGLVALPNLDWEFIRGEMFMSGIRFSPDLKGLPEDMPLVVRQCIAKTLEKDG